MDVFPNKPTSAKLNTKSFRGSEINTVFARFMPMFYAHINRILNHFKTGKYDLNENQIKVIMAVSYLGQVSPSQLSRTFHIFKGSLTTIIRSLVSMELLSHRADPHDARKYYLTITEKAQAFILEKNTHDEQHLDKLFSDMPDSDLHKVCEGLSILSDYLEKSGAE